MQKLKEVKEKVAVLQKRGGFKLLRGIIDSKKGIRDLDPGKGEEIKPEVEAKREIFLTDPGKKALRKSLKTELEILKNLIETEDGVKEAEEKSAKITEVLTTNYKNIFKATREIEKSYRGLNLFFKNAKEDKIKNLYIANISLEEFKSADNSNLRKEIKDHFNKQFDRFSLEDNYSLFVIPGYLENCLDEWNEIAHKYKMMLVTDFEDTDDFEIIEEAGGKTKGDRMYHANAVVTCNWGVVRKKYEGIEAEDFCIPMSMALAGKMFDMDGVQPPAGNEFGKLEGVIGTRLNFLRTNVDVADSNGMIPVIYEKDWGGAFAMSDITRFADASDPEYKALATVKAKDWLGKVLVHYLNKQTFKKYTPVHAREIKSELSRFFNKIKGHKGMLEDFVIEEITRHPDNDQAIVVPIQVKFHTATKHFLIDFIGRNGKFEEDLQKNK